MIEADPEIAEDTGANRLGGEYLGVDRVGHGGKDRIGRPERGAQGVRIHGFVFDVEFDVIEAGQLRFDLFRPASGNNYLRFAH